MTLGKQKRRWIRATLLSSLLASASVASADFTEPLNRFGRTFGVGWGDGYHACKSSGICISADLPPRSYAARQKHAASLRVHRSGSTFYDRFDASSGRGCDSCDAAPYMTDIHGSQVTYGAPTAGPWEAVADNGQPSLAPTPATPIQPPIMGVGDEVRTALNPPQPAKQESARPNSKIYPTRPSMAESPSLRDLASRTPARSVASDRFANGFGIGAAPPAETRPATPSRTPNAITPVHPHDRRTSSSAVSEPTSSVPKPAKNSFDTTQLSEGHGSRAVAAPPSDVLQFPTLVPPKRAMNPVATGPTTEKPVQPAAQMPIFMEDGTPATITPNGPNYRVSDIPSSAGRPKTINQSTKTRRSDAKPGRLGKSTDLQSVQLVPKSGGVTNPLPKRPVSFAHSPTPPASEPAQIAKKRRARPQRSTILPPSMRRDSTYGVTPVVSDLSSATVSTQKKAPKPSRLGAKTMPVAIPGDVLSGGPRGSVRDNPYAARPVLELAKRSDGLDSNVIRQPDVKR